MQTEEVARIDAGDGLEVIVSRVHNQWEARAFKDLTEFVDKPCFLDKLINAVAQLRYDRLNGEGSFSKLYQPEMQKEFKLASQFVTAIRDLGHLLN